MSQIISKETLKKNRVQGSQRPEIIYFGQSFDFLKTASRPNEDLIFLQNPQDAFAYLKDERAAILMAVLSPNASDSAQVLEVLERFEQDSPRTARILVVHELTRDLFKLAVNQAHIHFCLDISDFKQRWKDVFNLAVQRYHQATAKAQLLKESTLQFRELEALNTGLEQIVLERTQHIEISKVEEEEKLNKVRSLIRLIKDLARVGSFEELLLLLRKESRKFHKIGDPILVYQSSPDRVEFVSLQSGQVLFNRHSGGSFPFPHEIVISGKEVIKSLANHFGRPFIKTLYIPLEPRLMRENSFADAQAGVCLEVSLNEAELESFLDFIRERIQSVAITVDRLMLETDLIEFSYRWEKTFDGFRDPVAIVDVAYEVLRSNKKFSNRVVKKTCFESFAQKRAPCEGCPVPLAIATSLPQTGQIQVGGKLFEVHSFPLVLDNGGRPTNVVNQYVDITQARELYLRMLQSEKMGAIGLLAGNIAHELNNPLTGLRSLAQVLMSETTHLESLNSDLSEIERAAGRSQQIIKNLLEFSWGTSQQKKLTTIDDIVMKTMPMLKAVMRLHRQDFDLSASQTFIEVEPHLIQQVVFNLVNNACQAMKDSGTLTVKTFLRPEENSVVLQIQDTGSGIPENLREKIFEPFFTTKKEGLGTGLGLSLTKKIVESSGGKIQVISPVGEGALFEVILPQVPSSAGET